MKEKFPIFHKTQDILNLEWTPFKLNQTRAVLNFPGIYALVNKISGEIEYIGRSNRIGRRLLYGIHNHPHRIFDKTRHNIMALRIEGKERQKYFEAEAIRLINPPRNKRRGSYTSKAIENMVDDFYKTFRK